MPEKIKSIPRRNFFGNIGKAIAGLLLFSAFPVKVPARNKKTVSSGKKIRIIEHPMAVKRNKKGLRG